MSVSLGIHTGQQNQTMADLRRLWRWADEQGLDWISVWDHFYEAPPVDGMSPHFESTTCMATIAAETERVRIGCLVFCVPYRNPATLAKTLMTLDHISDGRIEPGLGAGWHEMEFRGYGYGFPPLRERFEMLEEGTQIIKSMLGQERTDFEGIHYNAVGATCQPPPVQEHMPLWIGGRGEKKTLRMAAQYADGWNVPYIGVEEFARLGSVLDAHCANLDRDPGTIQRTVNLQFALRATAEGAAEAEAGLREQWGEQAARVSEGSLLGTPDDAFDRVSQYIEAGADGVNVAMRAPWDEAALEAYVTEVVPALRAKYGAWQA